MIFPEVNNFTLEVITEVWAGIVNANQDYMRYVSYLNTVIETNVTVERLAVFKKKYYDLAYAFRDRLAQMLGTTQDAATKILWYRKLLNRLTLLHRRWIFIKT